MTNKRTVGKIGEEAAASFLKAKGVRILDMNFKVCRGGEIDIIGLDRDGTLLFIEVKYRKNDKAGNPLEAVGVTKQRSICRASDFYRAKKLMFDYAVRYDVIAVEKEGTTDELKLTWIKNAFEYTGSAGF